MIGKHMWPLMRRGPIGASLMILITGAVMWWIASDALYFFRIGDPVDLGDAAGLDPRKLGNDTFVRIRGLAAMGNVISYDRGSVVGSLFKRRHAFFPLLGPTPVFVEITRAEGDKARSLPEAFTGRLRQAGKVRLAYRQVFRYMNDTRGLPVPDDAWIVFDAETPIGKWWAVLLEILFLFFILNNVRLLRLHFMLRRLE